MEIEKAIEILEDGNWWNYLPDYLPEEDFLQSAIDTALSALREQQKRQKGCFWCKSGAFDESRVKVNFCPVCGRPLKEAQKDEN